MATSIKNAYLKQIIWARWNFALQHSINILRRPLKSRIGKKGFNGIEATSDLSVKVFRVTALRPAETGYLLMLILTDR